MPRLSRLFRRSRPEPLPHAGVFPQSLLGWRRWRVSERGKLLAISDIAPIPDGAREWRAPAEAGAALTRAACKQGHPAPDPRCECGLYARDYAPGESIREILPGYVSGWVAARGEICLHDEGFRAEEMQILALYLPRRGWLLRKLRPRAVEAERLSVELAAARYGVPVYQSSEDADEAFRRSAQLSYSGEKREVRWGARELFALVFVGSFFCLVAKIAGAEGVLVEQGAMLSLTFVMAGLVMCAASLLLPEVSGALRASPEKIKRLRENLEATREWRPPSCGGSQS